MNSCGGYHCAMIRQGNDTCTLDTHIICIPYGVFQKKLLNNVFNGFKKLNQKLFKLLAPPPIFTWDYDDSDVFFNILPGGHVMITEQG